METSRLLSFIRTQSVDVAGIAGLGRLADSPKGLITDPAGLLQKFGFAVVVGAQLNKIGGRASGTEVDLFLERAALETAAYLEGKGFPAFIVHPEDEFDPARRLGLLPLKVLAKAAALGGKAVPC